MRISVDAGWTGTDNIKRPCECFCEQKGGQERRGAGRPLLCIPTWTPSGGANRITSPKLKVAEYKQCETANSTFPP